MAILQERTSILALDRVGEADHTFADEGSLAGSHERHREGFFVGLLAAMHESRRCQARREIDALAYLIRQVKAHEIEFGQYLARQHRRVEAPVQASHFFRRDVNADANIFWRVLLQIVRLGRDPRTTRNTGAEL